MELEISVQSAKELNEFIADEFICDKILVFISRGFYDSLRDNAELNLLDSEDSTDPLESDIIYALFDEDQDASEREDIIERITDMWLEIAPKKEVYSVVKLKNIEQEVYEIKPV